MVAPMAMATSTRSVDESEEPESEELPELQFSSLRMVAMRSVTSHMETQMHPSVPVQMAVLLTVVELWLLHSSTHLAHVASSYSQ